MPAAVFCRSPDQAAPAARSCCRLQQQLEGREEQGGAAASSSPAASYSHDTARAGCIFRPRQPRVPLFETAAPAPARCKGFLLEDALGVDLLDATDSERCKLCAEAKDEKIC